VNDQPRVESETPDGSSPSLDLSEILERALALDRWARSEYLDRVCARRDDLRREVDSLIDAADPARNDARFREPDPFLGRTISGFAVMRLIGEGGHGRVYLARQLAPDRNVALKIMSGGLLSKSARRRFEYESELLARLRHPGIAHVYEAGVETIGGTPLPWFAMEHIEGSRTIVEYVREARLTHRERARLAIEVCEIVQYGHQNGVIHRDLKPSNILVGSNGRARVIDFGVASTLGGDRLPLTLATHAGDLLGTLAYMSPDLCGGDASAADARADTYALGAVLYEMLTLEPAFDLRGMAVHEAIRTIREGSPKRASLVQPALRGDLEAIVMKALERLPVLRYQSPASLAADLQAFLDGGPVGARKQTVLYRLQRYVERRWIPLAIASSVSGLLTVSTLVSINAMQQERAARLAEVARSDELALAVERAESDARLRRAVVAFLTEQVLGAIPSRSGKPEMTAREALLAATKRIPEIADGDLRVEVELRSHAAGALQGMNELAAARDEYARVIECAESAPGQPDRILSDTRFVNILGVYGLLQGALKDPGAQSAQERAYREGIALLGAGNPHTINAGARYLAGCMARDGFSSVRDETEALYASAVAAVGAADVSVQPLRQMLIRGLMYSAATDRARATELLNEEIALASRGVAGELPDSTRFLEFDVLVATGDGRAMELGRQLVAESSKSFAPTAPISLLRRGGLLRALRHHGQWEEATAVAEIQAKAQSSAPTASAADRMDAWLDLAVVAAEAGSRQRAAEAIAKAEEERALVPATSMRPRVAALDRIRAEAILDGGASAAARAAELAAALEAVTGTRPLTLFAKHESQAIMARLQSTAGESGAAEAQAQAYLDACDEQGLHRGALAREMEQLVSRSVK
jgi:serine/threonine protein kinase